MLQNSPFCQAQVEIKFWPNALLCVLIPNLKTKNYLRTKSLETHWFTDSFYHNSGTDKPECVRHATIDDPTRYYSLRNIGSRYGGGNVYMCDRYLPEGWYRFLLGKEMATSYSGSSGYCQTNYQGRLLGGHPSVPDGLVTREVCFQRSYSCSYRVNIKVRNCGNFYVYKLKPTPTCNLRYCTQYQ